MQDEKIMIYHDSAMSTQNHTTITHRSKNPTLLYQKIEHDYWKSVPGGSFCSVNLLPTMAYTYFSGFYFWAVYDLGEINQREN
jgi:hypothetical protein